jgi:hypothetical protein
MLRAVRCTSPWPAHPWHRCVLLLLRLLLWRLLLWRLLLWRLLWHSRNHSGGGGRVYVNLYCAVAQRVT